MNINQQGNNNEHFVCRSLGLNGDITDLLLKKDNEFMSHQSIEYWIEKYMDYREKSMGNDLDIKQQFEYLGFNEMKAKILKESLVTNPFSNHQSTKYWATLYIDYFLAKYKIRFEFVKGT